MLGVVEGAAGDSATPVRAGAVPVGEDGLGEAAAPEALDSGPAVVGARLAGVDLLPSLLADVVYVDLAGTALDREGVGVAQALGPDGPVVAAGRVVEGVVLRDGSVRVDPEHLPEQGTHALGGAVPLVVADGHVELAVRAEVDGPTVVVVGLPTASSQVVELEDERLAPRLGDVPVVGVGLEPDDAIVGRGPARGTTRVVDVDEVVGGEGRIERDAQKPPLAPGAELSEMSTNGWFSNSPFVSITRSFPPFSATNKRPSGANSSPWETGDRSPPAPARNRPGLRRPRKPAFRRREP